MSKKLLILPPLVFGILLLANMNLLHAQENNSILCSDGIDNDGDGLIDCLDDECFLLSNDGCLTCSDGISFADTLLDYIPGCPHFDLEPEGALGLNDWTGGVTDEFEFVFLGQGGIIKLGFTNNLLTNSGDAQSDFNVFEVGPVVEPCNIALRPADLFTNNQLLFLGIPDANGDGYFEIGSIGGATSGIDIDGVITGFSLGMLKFDAIEITDIDDNPCHNGTVGADIDAVCALFTTVADCEGTINGTAVIDECGECLELTDPTFNQSCVDCAGIINGTAVIDECGECLELTSPTFNQSCADCAGTANGIAIIDECGECLELTDPAFNQSCTDCTGVLNGTAVIDNCGECLEPTDPMFNQSCIVEHDVYIPNVFSPNDDGVNDLFQLYAKDGVIEKVTQYEIYDRWGEQVFKQYDFDLTSTEFWWDGLFRNQKMQPAIYVYIIEIEFTDGYVKQYLGDLLLLR